MNPAYQAVLAISAMAGLVVGLSLTMRFLQPGVAGNLWGWFCDPAFRICDRGANAFLFKLPERSLRKFFKWYILWEFLAQFR